MKNSSDSEHVAESVQSKPPCAGFARTEAEVWLTRVDAVVLVASVRAVLGEVAALRIQDAPGHVTGELPSTATCKIKPPFTYLYPANLRAQKYPMHDSLYTENKHEEYYENDRERDEKLNLLFTLQRRQKLLAIQTSPYLVQVPSMVQKVPR